MLQQSLKKWGNNLGLRLPADIVRKAHLAENQSVSLSVVKGKIVIAPLSQKTQTLEERLEQFDPKQHGGETMIVSKRLGAEQ